MHLKQVDRERINASQVSLLEIKNIEELEYVVFMLSKKYIDKTGQIRAVVASLGIAKQEITNKYITPVLRQSEYENGEI